MTDFMDVDIDTISNDNCSNYSIVQQQQQQPAPPPPPQSPNHTHGASTQPLSQTGPVYLVPHHLTTTTTATKKTNANEKQQQPLQQRLQQQQQQPTEKNHLGRMGESHMSFHHSHSNRVQLDHQYVSRTVSDYSRGSSSRHVSTQNEPSQPVKTENSTTPSPKTSYQEIFLNFMKFLNNSQIVHIRDTTSTTILSQLPTPSQWLNARNRCSTIEECLTTVITPNLTPQNITEQNRQLLKAYMDKLDEMATMLEIQEGVTEQFQLQQQQQQLEDGNNVFQTPEMNHLFQKMCSPEMMKNFDPSKINLPEIVNLVQTELSNGDSGDPDKLFDYLKTNAGLDIKVSVEELVTSMEQLYVNADENKRKELLEDFQRAQSLGTPMIQNDQLDQLFHSLISNVTPGETPPPLEQFQQQQQQSNYTNTDVGGSIPGNNKATTLFNPENIRLMGGMAKTMKGVRTLTKMKDNWLSGNGDDDLLEQYLKETGGSDDASTPPPSSSSSSTRRPNRKAAVVGKKCKKKKH